MYDLLVIGAGVAGYTAAIRAAKEGLKTAVAEAGDIGGTCLNRGCIPTKYMLSQSQKYRILRQSIEAKQYEGNLSFHYKKIRDEMALKVGRLSSGIKGLLHANNVDLFNDRAEFINENTVVLSGCRKQLQSRNIMIATGSSPRMVPVYIGGEKVTDLDRCRNIFTTDNVFTCLDRIPESVIILGGGAVGLEFAFIFSGFGSKVTVLEGRTALFEDRDADIDTALFRGMKQNNIEFKGGCMIDRVAECGNKAAVYDVDAKLVAEAEAVLIAVGRKASCESLHVEKAGITVLSHGIETDSACRTSVKNIYAAGDVNGKQTLAYAAAAQAVNVVSRLKGRGPLKDESLIPMCLFTEPEIAFVGHTARMAEAEGRKIITEKFLMSANGRSSVDGNGGFIKLTADSASRVMIGGECVCHGATELISQITLAVKNKMTLDAFAETVFPHPTYSEALGEAAELIDGNCIYML